MAYIFPVTKQRNHKGTLSFKYLKSVQVLASGETLPASEGPPLPSAVLDAVQGCHTAVSADAHYLAHSSVMKSTCPLHCLCKQSRPPSKLRRLKPQVPTGKRPRRRNLRPAFKCPSHWDTFVHHISLCTSHLREICHTTLQHVLRASWTSLQPRHPCENDFRASSSATTPPYSRPGPKSGVRSWLRNLILMTILARPYGVRVPAQAAWAGGGSTVAREHTARA